MSYLSYQWGIGSIKCLNPDGTDANVCIETERGPYPGVAKLLFRSGDAATVMNAGAQTITVNAYTRPEAGLWTLADTINFPGWYPVSSRAIPNDPTKVEVTFHDQRKFLAETQIRKRFNIRKNTGDTAEYVEETTNEGTPWTASQIVGQLLAQHPNAQSLSVTATNVPKNLVFDGTLAEAIESMLATLGLCYVRNPFTGAVTAESVSASGGRTQIDAAITAKRRIGNWTPDIEKTYQVAVLPWSPIDQDDAVNHIELDRTDSSAAGANTTRIVIRHFESDVSGVQSIAEAWYSPVLSPIAMLFQGIVKNPIGPRVGKARWEYRDRSTTSYFWNGVLKDVPWPKPAKLLNKSADDPDTPFRNTVRFLSGITEERGSVYGVGATSALITDESLGLEAFTPFASAVERGTVSFLREPIVSDGTPQLKKTNNGGITPAIVYMQAASHLYAIPDSRSTWPAANRYLISAPYGPYRILARKPIDPAHSASSFPYFANATVKDQAHDRTIAKYDLANIDEDPTDSSKQRVSWVRHDFIQSGLSSQNLRFEFPEISLNGTTGVDGFPSGHKFVKSGFTAFAPNVLYLFDFYLQGRANYVYSNLYTILDSGGTSRFFSQFAQRSMVATVRGKLENDAWETIATETVLVAPSTQVTSPANTPWSVRLTCPWIELHKEIRVELASASGITIIEPGGTVLLHRLGDRGLTSGYGARSWGTYDPGVYDPVAEPEPA